MQINYFTLYKIPANTLFVGKNVVFVPECHSTNTLALELSQNQSTTEGTVVITSHQTAGRGQRGNSWEAQPGENLTLSVILTPRFLPVRDQFFLNIVTSLALHDFLTEQMAKEVQVKWPNDILCNGKKLCGILIENQLQGLSIASSVVGIGLNVNQQTFTNENATSMTNETGKSFDLADLFVQLMMHLEAQFLQLRSGALAELKARYLAALYRRGEIHRYMKDGQEFAGEIIGINEEGKLAMKVDNAMSYFEVREIKYI